MLETLNEVELYQIQATIKLPVLTADAKLPVVTLFVEDPGAAESICANFW